MSLGPWWLWLLCVSLCGWDVPQDHQKNLDPLSLSSISLSPLPNYLTTITNKILLLLLLLGLCFLITGFTTTLTDGAEHGIGHGITTRVSRTLRVLVHQKLDPTESQEEAGENGGVPPTSDSIPLSHGKSPWPSDGRQVHCDCFGSSD